MCCLAPAVQQWIQCWTAWRPWGKRTWTSSMQLPAVPTSFSKVTDLMRCGRSCISHDPISLHTAEVSIS